MNLGSAGAALNGDYHHWVADGAPTLGATGIPGGGAGNTSVHFGGDSQVYISDSAPYTAYTLEAWVKPDSVGAAQNVLVRTQNDPRTTWSHQLHVTATGNPRHRTWDGSERQVTGPAAAPAGEWTHLVATAVNNSQMQLYVNGVSAGATTLGTLWNSGTQWRVASPAGGGTGDWFRGAVDEVAIYQSVLPADRIMDHYAVGTTAQTAPPAGVPAPTSWLKADAILGHADGAAVSVWGDASGNGNHAAQTDLARQPTYVSNGIGGMPSVRFDGNDILTSVASFGNPYSIFAVTQMEGSQNFRLVTSQDVNWLLGNWGGRENVLHANGWVKLDPNIPADTLPHLYAAVNDSSKTALVSNGQVLAYNAAGTAPIGKLQLGGWLTTYTEASKADVAEVIVYDHVLTMGEYEAVHTYLAGKYGLTLYGPAIGEAKGFGGASDLDLSGDMVYAVNVSPNAADSPKQVGGATFTADTATAGVSVAATNSINNWLTKPEYGSTTDDDNLEEIMWDIRFGSNNAVTANMDVVRGNTYKVQLLFSDTYTEPGKRPFDINIEGALAHDEFDPVYYRGTWDNINRGAVYTATFVAGDNELNVSLTPGSTGTDKNAILNGFTLEQVAAKPVKPPITTEHIRLHLGEQAGATRAVDAAFADGVQSGNWSGTPVYDVPGIPANEGIDTAVQLNGTQQLTVMDAADPTAYTLEAWIKPSVLANMNILDRTSSTPGHVSHELRLRADGKIEHYTYDGSGKTIASTTAAQADQWVHVAAVATNGGRMQLYVNGQLENEWGNLGTLWQDGDRWRIAGQAGSFGGFNGTMDEVSIHPIATSGDQIFLRYRQAVSPTVPRDPTPKAGYSVYSLNLADIVGGGNGLGTGTYMAGINPGTGGLVGPGDPNPGTVTGDGFHPVADLPFVDGVFIPHAAGYMQIATTGLTMQHNYPARDGNSWDYFRNGPTGGTTSVLGGVDYASAGHSLIGMHANKGITFDLDAIRAA
ncbi:MAG TPA: malectin domain-containing carbohydrate-binding protein, partial [Phycisphaerae bacterium]|nr:malectin domain-containing carbohydrate-binding protein [Phycisphaerae bacterium]